MSVISIFLYFFAVMSVICAFSVILSKNPVTSAINLIIVFFSFGAIYALMKAHFISVIQILLYAGAVMVLFLFVIMLLGSEKEKNIELKDTSLLKCIVTIISATSFLLMVRTFKSSPSPSAINEFSPLEIEKAGGNTVVISEILFSKYILPFELTSILILTAICGVVAIAMRKKHKGVSKNV